MAKSDTKVGATLTVKFVRDSLAHEIGPRDTPFYKGKTYPLSVASAERWMRHGAANVVERKKK
jgi:hypothetical protein